ncbi:hypothetical protein [Sphingorhabdus sp. M41]|uniref:hypothetical protein n=1 Tax=Sphingorhabdus sp. M41 TaxID=1806885 RepID=UPI00078C3BE4|nr:hypothetical protein [Sphingorhabdus sp. M41]AMO71149.1 hypothetical protein AZE99_04155 [Sphingorhabdus sp. M41]
MPGNDNFRRAGQGAFDSAFRAAAEYLDRPEMTATDLKVAFEENDAALILGGSGEQDHAAGALRYSVLGAGAEWQYDAGDLAGRAACDGGAVVG